MVGPALPVPAVKKDRSSFSHPPLPSLLTASAAMSADAPGQIPAAVTAVRPLVAHVHVRHALRHACGQQSRVAPALERARRVHHNSTAPHDGAQSVDRRLNVHRNELELRGRHTLLQEPPLRGGKGRGALTTDRNR
eukprot:scaffold12036_cov80-Isochrysis_galbana.AAC.2